MSLLHEVCDWIVKVYVDNDERPNEQWVIQNRTALEAEREADADVARDFPNATYSITRLLTE